MDDLPARRTDRFAQPFETSWTDLGDVLVAEAAACRASNWGHRIALVRAPADWEMPFRTWREHHAGKGVQTAYVELETAAVATPPPDLPPGLRLEVTLTGRMEDGGPIEDVAGYDLRLAELADWPAIHAAAVEINGWQEQPREQAYLDAVVAGRIRQAEAGALAKWIAVERATGEVASMVAVVDGPRESRFQDVQTREAQRKRGLATALLTRAIEGHRGRRPGLPLWINVHVEGTARPLYERLGFVPESQQWCVSRPAPRDEAAIVRLVERFEAATLPIEEWHHVEHVVVAVSFLRDAGRDVDVAMDRMRAALHRFLDTHGIETTPERGYHETITRGWLQMTAAHLAGRDDEPLEDAVLGATTWLGDKLLPLRHWRKETLMSAEARAGWVPPDVAPIA